jgi:hypothetical protein
LLTDLFEETMMQIELGHGDKLVTDTHNFEEGWAGFCISDGDCAVGETIDMRVETDLELKPELRIITKNPKSLDVIIAACERAKKYLAS